MPLSSSTPRWAGDPCRWTHSCTCRDFLDIGQQILERLQLLSFRTTQTFGTAVTRASGVKSENLYVVVFGYMHELTV